MPDSTPARFTGRTSLAGGLHPSGDGRPAVNRAAAPCQRGLAGDEHRPRCASASCGTPPGDQSPGYAAAPRQRGLMPDSTPARFTGRRFVAGGLHPSGDPTAARRPSEPDIRPATAARRVHFKRGGRSAETSASSVEPLTAKRVGRRAIEIAATTAKPPFVGHAPKLKCTRADGRVCNRGRVHEEGFLIARPTASPGLAAGCADR